MSTKTILKDDGIFVYQDYYFGKAALRVAELTAANPVQNIRRYSDSKTVEAVLVSAAWYDTALAAFNKAAFFKQSIETRADDYLGPNMSTMIDYINGHAQTKDLVKTVAERGLTTQAFKTYEIIKSAAWYEDASVVIPFEESSKKAGNAVAYLIHAKLYELLSTVTPVATTYAGTGNGTLQASLSLFGAVAETITLTATVADPTKFDLVGSVSGAIGTASVWVPFVCTQGEFLLVQGTIAFIAGDAFVVTSFASGI